MKGCQATCNWERFTAGNCMQSLVVCLEPTVAHCVTYKWERELRSNINTLHAHYPGYTFLKRTGHANMNVESNMNMTSLSVKANYASVFQIECFPRHNFLANLNFTIFLSLMYGGIVLWRRLLMFTMAWNFKMIQALVLYLFKDCKYVEQVELMSLGAGHKTGEESMVSYTLDF